MKSKFKIDITDEFDAIVSIIDTSDNTYKTKTISLDDLIDSLVYVRDNASKKIERLNCEEESTILYTSPIFSSRNGVSIVQHIIKDENTHTYIIKKDTCKVNFQYYNDTYDINIPTTLFVVKVKDNMIINVRVFALDDDFVHEKSKLYSYPFSNVYEDGRICFGNNRISSKKFKNFKDILSIPAMFYSMPSTHELRNRNKYNMEYKILLEHLKDNKFDNKMLIEEKIQMKELINI